jgi:rhomboid family GlyGly-CTERM serine protease
MIANVVTVLSAGRATERAADWLSRRLDVWVTIGLSLLVVAAALVPAASTGLELDRTAVASGEWWRVVTGHFVHWNVEHLTWDLLVFVVVGAICERRSRVRFAITLSVAAMLISAAAWWLLPQVASYRGLSGLDTAIFALLAVSVFRESWERRQWHTVGLMSVLIAALAAKIGFEAMTGGTWFVDSSRGGFQPVPLAHVVGALCGLVCCVGRDTKKEKEFSAG